MMRRTPTKEEEEASQNSTEGEKISLADHLTSKISFYLLRAPDRISLEKPRDERIFE